VAKRGIGTAAVLELLEAGGLGRVADVLGTGGAIAAGAAVVGKAARVMFSDPIPGGLLAAHGSQVLSSLPIVAGDEDRPVPPPTDIRRAAMDLASRVRSITPDDAARSAGGRLGPDTDPVRLVKVQEAARVRHQVIQEVV